MRILYNIDRIVKTFLLFFIIACFLLANCVFNMIIHKNINHIDYFIDNLKNNSNLYAQHYYKNSLFGTIEEFEIKLSWMESDHLNEKLSGYLKINENQYKVIYEDNGYSGKMIIFVDDVEVHLITTALNLGDRDYIQIKKMVVIGELTENTTLAIKRIKRYMYNGSIIIFNLEKQRNVV